MSNPKYKKQVNILLTVLPAVAKEECFAMHGGTAINLFVRDMPRFSVDIDLTYLPIEDRATTLRNIDAALRRIQERIQTILPRAQILYKPDTAKLIVRHENEEIKIEVNLVSRGTLAPPARMILCEAAQEMFDRSSVIQVVPVGQLYGGKLCAALDRQHPRDLFDVKLLMENEGFSEDVHRGFLLCLLCSDRPINEVLMPNFQDQRKAMENQFTGMSDLPFTYEDFECTREQLVRTVNQCLTDTDKKFLLSIKNCTPDWNIYDFERFPAVQWKLQNLGKLKENNPDKHKEQFDTLARKLAAQ